MKPAVIYKVKQSNDKGEIRELLIHLEWFNLMMLIHKLNIINHSSEKTKMSTSFAQFEL